MLVYSLIILSIAFSLRSAWSSRRREKKIQRMSARWRAMGWLLLAALTGLSLRPIWPHGEVSSLLLVPVFIIALWVIMDPSIRSGGRGALTRTLVGFLVCILSLISIVWIRLGNIPSNEPILIVELTSEVVDKEVAWQLPGQSSRTQTLPHHKVRLRYPNQEMEPPLLTLELLGDVLSVRAQRIRLWWPLELLGLPPVVWLDAVRSEYLDPQHAEEYPAQYQSLPHTPTLLGPSVLSWCTLVWKRAFRSGIPPWWIETVHLESIGVSLIDLQGKSRKASYAVVSSGSSLMMRAYSPTPLGKETKLQGLDWYSSLKDLCPSLLCPRSSPISPQEPSSPQELPIRQELKVSESSELQSHRRDSAGLVSPGDEIQGSR
jgi:hypothetical protein